MTASTPSTPASNDSVLVQKIEAEARRYAGHYPEASDGRNTFVMFADWVSSLAAAPASPEPASNEAPGRGGVDVGTGEYRPDVWQVVVDQLGYESVYETDEDGRPGDLVAHVYGDNVALVTSAPRLRKALIALLAVAGTPITDSQSKVFAEARAAIAASLGVSVSAAQVRA